MAFFKTMWKNNSKHKKLSEEMALQQAKDAEAEATEAVETEQEIVNFKLKYLGSTVVEKMSGDNISTEAVKNIIKTTKASKGRKKLQRAEINISLKGIVVTDHEGNDILKISIYRISNCSTDPAHKQIFSFISTDANETMECHAFLCAKRKMAETVTLAVAHAFSTAYEEWKTHPAGTQFSEATAKEMEKNKVNEESHGEDIVDRVDEEERLIDFDNEPYHDADYDDVFKLELSPSQKAAKNHWVCFDDDFGNGTPSKTPFHQVDLILA